jgi:hypothetical protein
MIKYISDLVNQFKSRKNGIAKNLSLWAAMPVSDATIDPIIAELEAIETKIDDAESALQQLRNQAKNLVASKQKDVTQIDNLAYGIHASDTAKLADYGIVPRKPGTQKPVPQKGMVKVIVDDLDGEGFILERDTLADADNYEWQKAPGDDASVTNIDEGNFNHFKITKKRTFVDDNVKKGVRYFYRFRGINNAGNGPWSEPVSRVQ